MKPFTSVRTILVIEIFWKPMAYLPYKASSSSCAYSGHARDGEVTGFLD